ncbi:fibronectin type III domain-containing protein [Rhodococcus aetherivorans]|uniref:fibronectin type III domain-containing protein n=1 Tax=Rhodococcus aetherivorans TaxID=191292 RepID=UPI0031D8D4BA
MTAPDQSNPDGSLGPGLFAQRQAMTEDDAKRQMRSNNLAPWGKAQENMQAYMAGVGREVTRLDNRIDEIVIGGELVHVATFSESDVWVKPPGAARVVVASIAGASGGGHGNNSESASDSARGGLGGYSGGWSRGQIQASDLPDNVAVVVGAGSSGATSVGNAPAAGESRFGDLVIATGATGTNYGTGDYSFLVRGGTGAYAVGSRLTGWRYVGATYGGAGSFNPGGEAGVPAGSGNPGNNGYSVTEVGKVGMGSGGGGGAFHNGGSNGGRGGDGGWPSGPGGGGGGSNLGASGNGGNGAGGVVIVMTYREDKLGVAPTAPTGLAASNITSTGATLTWTASTDDIGVRRYTIFINGIQAGVSDNTTYTLTGLNPATTYSITVRAVDLGGNASDDSAPLSLITTA